MEVQETKGYTLEEIGFILNEKGKVESFISEKFVDSFLEFNKVIREKDTNSFLFLNNGLWEYQNQMEITRKCKDFIDRVEKYHWKMSFEKNIMHFLELKVPEVEKVNPHRHIIPFKDFDFDFKQGGIAEKSTDNYFTYAKDITEAQLFDAKAPNFEKLLGDITQGDNDFRRYLLQAMGILISGINLTNSIFILYGNGRNSKSLIIRLIEHLVGKSYVTSRKIESFNKQFGLDGLETAKLVTCGEIDISKPVNMEMAKSITGGDTVEVDGKFKDIKAVKMSLNFLFSTNNLFQIADDSDGVKRRLHVVEFAYQVPEDKVDLHLFEKLKQEEAGIFKLILDAYSDMISADGKLSFVMSENVKEFTKRYIDQYLVSRSKTKKIEEQQECIDFISTYFDKGTQSDKISKAVVYDLFCQEIMDTSEELFWKSIKDTLTEMDVKIKRNGERFLEGIKIKDEFKTLLKPKNILTTTRIRSLGVPSQNQSIEEVI